MNVLEKDYETLKTNYISMQKELETKNQEIYNCKNQLSRFTALEEDYLQEIEMLQSSNKVKELQVKVKQLEGSIIQIRNNYEPLLLKKYDSVEKLQNELKKLTVEKKKKMDCAESHSDHSQFLSLKDELTKLTNTLEEIEPTINIIKEHNSKLENNIKNLHIQVNEAKAKLKCRTDELSEVNKLIETSQGDLCEAKFEFESLKNKPLDANKKGNSLFSEVEDSRLKIQQCIVQQKRICTQMKHDLGKKLKQTDILQLQNKELILQINNISISKEKYHKMVEFYSATITDLDHIIGKYKNKILKEEAIATYSTDFKVKYATSVLKGIWNDVVNLRTELSEETKKKLKTFLEILSTNTERRKLKFKLLLHKIQIEEMQNKIVNLQLQNDIPDLKDSTNNIDESSIKVSTKTELHPEDTTEAFTENMVSKITESAQINFSVINHSASQEENTTGSILQFENAECTEILSNGTKEIKSPEQIESEYKTNVSAVSDSKSEASNSNFDESQNDSNIVLDNTLPLEGVIINCDTDNNTSIENNIIVEQNDDDNNEVTAKIQQCVTIDERNLNMNYELNKNSATVADGETKTRSLNNELNDKMQHDHDDGISKYNTDSILSVKNILESENINTDFQLRNISQESAIEFPESQCLSFVNRSDALETSISRYDSISNKENMASKNTFRHSIISDTPKHIKYLVELIDVKQPVMVEEQKKPKFRTPSKIPLPVKRSKSENISE